MQPVRKRLPTDSPHKIQTEMTLFTGKRSDNKGTPNRSYAQATFNNRSEALSDPEGDKDEEMEDAFTSDSSDTTPKQANATTLKETESIKLSSLSNPLSKKSQ